MWLRKRRVRSLRRVSDPVWYWPDPDQTSQDKLDPDPWFFQDRIQIQTPLSWKFSIYFMMIFNKKLFFLFFWRSLIIIFKFNSNKSLLEPFLHSFFAPASGGWNRIRIPRNFKTGSGSMEFWKPDWRLTFSWGMKKRLWRVSSTTSSKVAATGCISWLGTCRWFFSGRSNFSAREARKNFLIV